LFTLLTDTPERFDRALAALDGSYDIAPAGTPYIPVPLIRDRIS
jgi:thymidine phosphorylase